METSTRSKNSPFNGGSSNFIGYRHTISLKYISLLPDNEWSPPQQIKLDCTPFNEDDGVVFDLLDVIGPPFDWMLYHATPEHGSEDDRHEGKLDRGTIEYEIETAESEADRSLTEKEMVGIKLRLSDFEPKESYTLRGFRWDRVYPWENHGRLYITGRDYQLRAPVDLFNNRLDCSTNIEFLGFPGEEQNFPEWRFLCSSDKDVFYGTPFAIHTSIYESGELVHLDPYAHASIVLEEYRLEQYTTEDDHSDFPYSGSLYSAQVVKLDGEYELSVINGSLSDAIADGEADTLYLQSDPNGSDSYFVKRIGTTVSDGLVRKLFSDGLPELLSTATQRLELGEAAPAVTFEDEWAGVDQTNSGRPDFEGPYGVYYREIFFHIPFLIATHLNSQGKFEDAQYWLHFIFNPLASPDDEQHSLLDPISKDRSWRFLEFRQDFRGTGIPSLREQLTDTISIQAYKNDPFAPHAVARCPLRFSAYQKATVMKYIDNLLDWGDDLFARDTMESINEASLLYILAADILGERPAELRECIEGGESPITYEYIGPKLTKDNEFLIEMDHQVTEAHTQASKTWDPDSLSYAAVKAATNAAREKVSRGESKMGYRGTYVGSMENKSANSSESVHSSFGMSSPSARVILSQIPAFCIPFHEDVLAYWDRVEDRLFKIRNCMNISGIRRELSLFSPRIDPMMLIRAKAAGLSLDEVLSSISGDLPPYRFSYVVERAKAYAASLQGFGAALLSALEKKDVEELNLLRAAHQKNILTLAHQMRVDEYNVAVEARSTVDQREQVTLHRKRYYSDLISTELIDEESTQQSARNAATSHRVTEGTLDLLAGILGLLPQVGMFTSLNYGGMQLYKLIAYSAKFHRALASMNDAIAAAAGLEAGFKRRQQGWEFQRDLAEKELEVIVKDKAVSDIRVELAEQAIASHEKGEEQQEEILEYFRDKFTNEGLYTWLSAALQRLYREAYNNAYSMAKLAEQAYRFERGDDAAELIGRNHWVASKAGLLAGEGLLIDLQNLERRYLETNYRGLEVDQSFSLTQIDPEALIQLKETGVCTFDVAEIFFDIYYPGHYRRRIKAVRLTIPCITGPYTNVSATLALVSSQLRKEPKPGNAYLLDVPRSRSVSIATSTAQNDAGVFELNFRDERYMPFEGAGAVSTWELRLPKNFKQFDYQTINDVILHISYTAEQDASLRDTVEAQNAQIDGAIQKVLASTGLQRVFSLRQEFSGEFNRLLNSAAGTAVEFEISDKHFPIFLREGTLNIERAELILGTEAKELVKRNDQGEVTERLQIEFDQRTLTAHEVDARSDFTDGNADETEDARWRGLFYATLAGTDFAGGLIGFHSLSMANAGSLGPSQPEDTATVDPEILNDVYLYVSYTYTVENGSS